jgi:hypothetical protein
MMNMWSIYPPASLIANRASDTTLSLLYLFTEACIAMADVLSVVASCVEGLFWGEIADIYERLGYAPVLVSRAVLCVNKQAHKEFPKLLNISMVLAKERSLFTDRFISECLGETVSVPEDEMLSNLKNESLNLYYRNNVNSSYLYNNVNSIRRNVFEVCVNRNWIRCVNYILEVYAHVVGNDELKYCIFRGRVEMVRSFLEHTKHTLDLQMAFNVAVRDAYDDGGEIVKLLLSFGAIIDNHSPNPTLMIALKNVNHLAYTSSPTRRSNWVKNLNILLDHGAYIDHTVSNFELDRHCTLPVATPLTIAICRGPCELVEMLLENGANPKLGTPTPLEAAYSHRTFAGIPPAVPILLNPKYGVPRDGIFDFILLHSRSYIDKEFIHVMRSAGIRITADNMVNALKKTCVFPDALSTFLVYGGNPDAVDSRGTPLLVLAIEHGDSVGLLLKHGADISLLSAPQRRRVLRKLR